MKVQGASDGKAPREVRRRKAGARGRARSGPRSPAVRPRRGPRLAPPARATLVIALALVALVLLSFRGAIDNQFVYDDFQYLVGNPAAQQGLTPASARWAFSALFASNWHPVTWLSHFLDVSLFGLEPRGPHLVNVLLHAGNAVLLFLTLHALTGALWRSVAVAAFFAVHPAHVESVAWISERKDLLSCLFMLLAIGAYRAYVRRPGTLRYAAVAGLYAAGLASKPMLVTFPFLLLIADRWPLGRWRPGGLPRLLLEKVPFMALAAASSWLTVLAQREGGALRSVHQYSLAVRASNALHSYTSYLGNLAWPEGLAIFYPHPGPDLAAAKVGGAALLLAVATLGAVLQARKRPWLLCGWLWYLLTLVPVIGLVQVGDQAMADRYTYIPFTGLFIVVVWGAAEIIERFPKANLLARSVAIALPVVLAGLSSVQVSYWRDNESLFRRALSVTEKNWFAHISLAAVMASEGNLEGGVGQYREALRIKPQDPILQNNIAFLLGKQGKIEEAEALFLEASRLKPDYAEPVFNIGVLCLKRNDFTGAERQVAALDALDRRWADTLREYIRFKQGVVSGTSPVVPAY